MSKLNNFELHFQDSLVLIIADKRSSNKKITDDPVGVIDQLSIKVGGIGQREVYFKSNGEFTQMITGNEQFRSYFPCDEATQGWLSSDYG